MMLTINNVNRLAFTYYIPMIMVNAFLLIFTIDTDLLIYYPPMLLLFLNGASYMFVHKDDYVIKVSSVFLCYILFSVVLYAINDAPINCYFSSISKTVYPLLFVFLGYFYSDDNEFIKWLLCGCAFCFITGLFFYFTTPSYYVHYLAELKNASWYNAKDTIEETLMDSFRFSALFGDSYYVSYFSIPVLTISLSNTIIHRVNIDNKWLYLIAFVSFVSALLCMQRIAIAFALFVPLFYAFWSINRGAGPRLLYIYIFAFVLAIVVLSIISGLDRFEILKEGVLDRLQNMNFGDAMSQRTNQYTDFNRQTSWSLFCGLGAGSCGGYARAAGLDGVTDGWFVKAFYEFGIFGMLLFALIVIHTIIRAIKWINYYDSELMIVLFFLAACSGADALSSTIPTLLFWYSVGRIWNPRYFENLKSESLTNQLDGN